MSCPRELLRSWLVLAALATASPLAAQHVAVRPFEPMSLDLGYVADQFVVEFRRHVAHSLQALPPEAGRARANLPQVQALLDQVGAEGFTRQFAGARPEPLGGRYPDLTGYYLVELPAGASREAAMAVFAAHADVDHVEPIGIHAVTLTPNDTWYQYGTSTFPYDQWHYHDLNGIDADLGWDIETGAPGVIAGIPDLGVKYRHTDLGGNDPPGPADNVTQGNIWVNPFEIPGNGVDDEGNGFVDDVIGWDFVDAPIAGTCDGYDTDCGEAENDPNDTDGHGTHVGGTVAAITNNARAVAGIAGGFGDGTTSSSATGSKIVPLRIGHRAFVIIPGFGPAVVGIVSMAYAAQAFDYLAGLVDLGLNVAAVNCSWGSGDSGGLGAAVANLQAHDVLVVTAAGNSNTTTTASNHYLASVAGVLTVAATDSFGVGASFTNFGSLVDLAAPGVDVMSTYHNVDDPDTNNMYVAVASGTSMAAPHVVGVATLLESYNPGLTAAEKHDLIKANVGPFGSGNTKSIGTGILNANLALMAAPEPVGVFDPPSAARAGLRLRAGPNPTRVATDLLIVAPPGERVSVAIVDAGGRVVRRLAGIANGAGALRLRWDRGTDSGLRAASGLYFVTAASAGARATHKLVVLE